MKNTLISIFPNTDLRCSHTGLRILASKHKKNADALRNGEFLLFLNRSQSQFKMFAANNTLIHYKSPHGRVNVDAIEHIPHCFNGVTLDYNKALKTTLDSLLKKRRLNGKDRNHN